MVRLLFCVGLKGHTLSMDLMNPLNQFFIQRHFVKFSGLPEKSSRDFVWGGKK